MPNYLDTGLSKAEILRYFRFLPRDPMLSAVYAVVVYLSVCLCV